MDPKEKLKPCPFCGGEGKCIRMRPSRKFVVVCQNDKCGASVGEYSPTIRMAYDAWNRRYKPRNTVVVLGGRGGGKTAALMEELRKRLEE